MPTPYGSRGGMAFSADELRVLRRALAVALHPASLSEEDVQDCLRLAGSLDEAVREAARLRAFLLADLSRYRDALPAAACGYLGLLQDALATGYEPVPDDLVALRGLRGTPAGAALLDRCRALAEQSVRARLAGRSAAPLPRTRLMAIAGGRVPAADEPPKPKKPEPAGEPLERPRPPVSPMPKPSEVFPPRRRPVPPREQRAAG